LLGHSDNLIADEMRPFPMGDRVKVSDSLSDCGDLANVSDYLAKQRGALRSRRSGAANADSDRAAKQCSTRSEFELQFRELRLSQWAVRAHSWQADFVMSR
jgi:hypothetical protein